MKRKAVLKKKRRERKTRENLIGLLNLLGGLLGRRLGRLLGSVRVDLLGERAVGHTNNR